MRQDNTIQYTNCINVLVCSVIRSIPLFGGVLHVQTDKRSGKPKVWIYKDKMTGTPKGEATVTFDDPDTAKAAIDWFNGKW